MTLSVNEIFYSIQGESLYAGLPCAFLRLSGCNLRCRYCDTAYAFAEGTPIPVGHIIAELEAFQCPIIEITGGEPLLQEKTPLLIRELLARGYTVLLETNGSRDIRCVDPRCVKIVDIKCPGSGESQKNELANLDHLAGHDQLKFVLTDRYDYSYAKDLLLGRWGRKPPVPVLLSPTAGMLEPAQLAAWILNDRLPVRLQLQLHKLIWPADTRAV